MPSAAAEQLAVDAAGIVHFGANNVQSAHFGYAFAQFDVGAAAGHVCGNGHFSGQAGPGDDIRFDLDVIRVKNLVLDASCIQQFERCSDLSIERVPINIGRPSLCNCSISSNTAAHLASVVPKTISGRRWRIEGRLVGIGSTWQR